MDFGQSFPDTEVRRAGLYGLVDNVHPSALRRYDLMRVRRWGAIPGSFGWMDSAYNPAAQYTQQDNSSGPNSLLENSGDAAQRGQPGFDMTTARALLGYLNQRNNGFLSPLRFLAEHRGQQGFNMPTARALLGYMNRQSYSFPSMLRFLAEHRGQPGFDMPTAHAVLGYLSRQNRGFPSTLRYLAEHNVGLFAPRWELG